MIRQQIGDILEIRFENNWFYLVILTKIILFGGNLVFAFHNDGKQMRRDELLQLKDGFNICTDLLLQKRAGLVQRIGKVEDVDPYFKTRYIKSTDPIGKGVKAKNWYIHHLDDNYNNHIVVEKLTDEFKHAMDSGTHSFNLVANKILCRYTPDQDDRI